MNYLNHKEFADLLCMAQSTFCDKVAKGAIPRHCKMTKCERGEKGKLWSEMKVECFMDRLIFQATELRSKGYFENHKSALGFGCSTIVKILKSKEAPKNGNLHNFGLTLNTLANIGK